MKPPVHASAPGEPAFTPRLEALEAPSDLPGVVAFVLLAVAGLAWAFLALGIGEAMTPVGAPSAAAAAAVRGD